MASDKFKYVFNGAAGQLDIVQDVATHVEGPASATDNAIATYDSTTGKLIKNSGASVQTDGRITAGADATGSLDVTTKQQLDAAIQGVDVKEGVKAASTANLTLSGEQTVDTIALVTGDRVLVKNQSTASENGVYLVDSGAWTRASDCSTAAELNGALVTVAQGSASQANTGWYQYQEIVTLDTDPVNFNQFFGAGTYTADGNGIELSGSTFSLELDGTTLSKSASGVKVAADGITNTEVAPTAAIAVSKLAALTASRAVASDGSGFLTPATTTAAELDFVSGVTSSIQTQLNGKEASFSTLPISKGGTNSGAALNNDRIMQSSGGAIIEAAAITASRALASNASGIPVAATTTAAELDFVSGVTSSIQTQLNGKQASGSYATTDLANLASTAINADLIFNKSAAVVQTKDDSSTATTALTVKTGAATGGTNASGALAIATGSSGSGSSGGLDINTGTAPNTVGYISIVTGGKSGSQAGTSGIMQIFTGNNSSSGTSGSGTIQVQTGTKSGTTAGNTGDLTIKSGNSTSTSNSSATGDVSITSGDQSGSGTSRTGAVTVRTGVKTSGTATSGNYSSGSGNSTSSSGTVLVSSGTGATSSGTAQVRTGDATAGTSGTIQINSGTGTTATGTATLNSGAASAGTSGVVTVNSGTGTTGTGAVNITTGNASAGNSGNVVLTTGTASGTRGSVSIDALNLNMNSTKIINVTDPSSAQDAATMAYADTKQNRATLTAKGDLYVATASNTVARQAVGTDGTFLKADSSVTNGITWVSTAQTYAVRSITTTDTLVISTDDIALLSGASFTLNLPTAVGNTGKRFVIKHVGTSLTQVYTVDGNSTETIDGDTTYLLYTNGETITIVSDGANWQVLEHKAETDWSGAASTTVTATTTNPTKGTGTTVDDIRWKRYGSFARIRLRIGHTVAGTAGSGTYLVELPAGLTADTTLTGTSTSTTLADVTRNILLGSGGGRENASQSYRLFYLYDSTHFASVIQVSGTQSIWGSGSHGFSATTHDTYGWFEVPISGWKD